VRAGRARRSGDLTALHESWQQSEPLLIEVEPDLWLLGPAGELAAAAVRLDPHRRTATWMDGLGTALDSAEATDAWRATRAWAGMQVALAADDDVGVAAAHEQLAALPTLPPALDALRLGAAAWVEVMAGRVDEASLGAAAEALEQAGRRWDASRLVGQAAVRCTDPAVARQLLGRARELAPAEADRGRDGGVSEVLSEREVEISRLVVEGRTHKEIGAQLFLSPKTVEHHVARIRTKLGAATRAEMLAALRRELGDPQRS
jgi:DNA-binding NarL/FixJ family response regulator